MSACRSRGVPRLGRTRIGFTFGLSARAGAGGHGATLGHAPAPRGGYSGQCAKPLRMATRDPTLDQRAHLLGSQSEKVASGGKKVRISNFVVVVVTTISLCEPLYMHNYITRQLCYLLPDSAWTISLPSTRKLQL